MNESISLKNKSAWKIFLSFVMTAAISRHYKKKKKKNSWMLNSMKVDLNDLGNETNVPNILAARKF